jgi:ABC-type sulfate transport system permease component
MSEERPGETRADERPAGDRSTSRNTAGRFASGIVRLGLAVIGVVLLLFAAGRIAGIDLLEMAIEVLASPIGRWIALAFVALVLIVIAVRGFSKR